MKLALFGSGEFTPAVDEIDKYLITAYKPSNIAVLPTAAGAESDSLKWLDMAKQHYAKFNLEVIPVPILNKNHSNDKSLTDLLIKADWIFFSGGDPGYLLNVIKGSILWEIVLKRFNAGALLSGSSAGAMVMGNFVLTRPFKAMFSNTDAVWAKGFGIIDYTIFPHFNQMQQHQKFFQRIILKSPDKVRSAWAGIDENTALIINNGEKSVQGLGQVEIHDISGSSLITKKI